jgi:hypothetical protein
MPLNPPALATGFLAPNFISVAHIGPGMPKLAMAVAVGVTQYLTLAAKVTTVDAGLLGVGTSLIPLLVPPVLLQPALYSGFASMGILGPMAPLTITALTNGLATGWAALALLQTNHPGIGTGAGVARITGPSAVPSMLFGFTSVGMPGDGPVKIATAIGIALDITFSAFFEPVPIVGASSPIGGAGVGFGTVI